MSPLSLVTSASPVLKKPLLRWKICKQLLSCFTLTDHFTVLSFPHFAFTISQVFSPSLALFFFFLEQRVEKMLFLNEYQSLVRNMFMIHILCYLKGPTGCNTSSMQAQEKWNGEHQPALFASSWTSLSKNDLLYKAEFAWKRIG